MDIEIPVCLSAISLIFTTACLSIVYFSMLIISVISLLKNI